MKPNERVVRVSPDNDGHYMHGFYNIQPWDRNGRRMLIHSLPFIDRMPTGAEPATIGLLDQNSRVYLPFAQTFAWNFQTGCMAHWALRSDGDEYVVYNDKRDGRFVSVCLLPGSGRERVFDCPIFTTNHDGKAAFGYDFARLHPLRPGYAYAGVSYPLAERPAPDDEGVMRIDLETGTTRLILSYARLAEAFPHVLRKDAPVFVSRLLTNQDDTRVVLSFRFKVGVDGRYRTCLVTFNPDGTDLRCLAGFDDNPAHFDWCGCRDIVVWMNPPAPEPAGFYLVDDVSGTRLPLAHGVLTTDGHCCFGTDRHRMLLDTFPDREGLQSLMIYDRLSGEIDLIGRFLMPAEYGWKNQGGDLRCDLHPCWSRTGDRVCFDSLHEGKRAVYIARAEMQDANGYRWRE